MTMIVKTGGVQETEVLNYIAIWEMNAIGSCLIVLDNTGGGSAAKYTPEDYMFKDIVVEYPADTAIWKGRIRQIEYVSDGVLLHGEGWPAQYRDQLSFQWDSLLNYGTVTSVNVEAKTITVDYTPADPAADQYIGYLFALKNAGEGAKSIVHYASEFEVSPQCFDGGNLALTKDNDWTGVLGERATYALCAKSGTVFTNVSLILTFHTTVPQGDIDADGLNIYAAAHVRGGDYGNSYLQVYNFDTETWDNLATGDCNHDFETNYLDKSKNYVSSDGYIKVRLLASAESQSKYLIFDFLKITIDYSTSYNPFLYTIVDNGGAGTQWITVAEPFIATNIQINDEFIIVGSCRNLLYIYSCGTERKDYQETMTADFIADNKLASILNWDFHNYWELFLDMAKQDGRDLYALGTTLKYGKYNLTTKTIKNSVDCILRKACNVDGNKLINRVYVYDGTTLLADQKSTLSKETYQDTWHEFMIRDASVPGVGSARDLAKAYLQQFDKLRKNPIVTLAGFSDINIGDIVEVVLSTQDISDFYIIRKKGFDYQQYETLLEMVLVPQEPAKKYDIVWDKLQSIAKRVDRLEARVD